jgi:type I restriction enzyme S subunit
MATMSAATTTPHTPWPTVKLGDVCEVLDFKRKPITKKDRISGEIPYYGATGIVDYVEGFLFEEKLVLLGEDGAKWGASEPSAFIVEGKTWVNNHAHVLRPKEIL